MMIRKAQNHGWQVTNWDESGTIARIELKKRGRLHVIWATDEKIISVNPDAWEHHSAGIWN